MWFKYFSLEHNRVLQSDILVSDFWKIMKNFLKIEITTSLHININLLHET